MSTAGELTIRHELVIVSPLPDWHEPWTWRGACRCSCGWVSPYGPLWAALLDVAGHQERTRCAYPGCPTPAFTFVNERPWCPEHATDGSPWREYAPN